MSDPSWTSIRDDIDASLTLGVSVEIDDPNLAPIVSTITPEAIGWIADWLAGEGFARRRP